MIQLQTRWINFISLWFMKILQKSCGWTPLKSQPNQPGKEELLWRIHYISTFVRLDVLYKIRHQFLCRNITHLLYPKSAEVCSYKIQKESFSMQAARMQYCDLSMPKRKQWDIIWKATYPRLYKMDRNPDWKVFLNIFKSCSTLDESKLKSWSCTNSEKQRRESPSVRNTYEIINQADSLK